MSHTKIEWETLDWSKNNADLGKEVGRTTERVRQIRAKLTIPPAQGRGGLPGKKRRPREGYRRWYDPNKTIAEMSRVSGLTKDQVRGTLGHYKLAYRKVQRVSAE